MARTEEGLTRVKWTRASRHGGMVEVAVEMIVLVNTPITWLLMTEERAGELNPQPGDVVRIRYAAPAAPELIEVVRENPPATEFVEVPPALRRNRQGELL